MNQFLLLIIVIVCGCALICYRYFSHRKNYDNSEKLALIVKKAFENAAKSPISQNRLIKEIKLQTGVNEKTALLLVGKAKKENLISIVDGQVELIK